MTIGAKIAACRKRAGMSQEKLANEADMERNYISLLELGKNSASVKKIFSLASALGVGVAEFMGMVEDRLKAVDLPPVIRSGTGES